MRSAGRLLVACCVVAVAAALAPQQLLTVPVSHDDWPGAAAMSSEFYVTSQPSGYGNGVVNVYTRDGSYWYSLHSREPADQFGFALALDGDDLLVGAPSTDVYAGAVHHFEISTGKLLRTYKAEAAYSFFGSSLAVCGGGSRLLMVGAPDEPNGEVPASVDDDNVVEATAYDDDYYDGWWYGAAYVYDLKTGERRLRLTDPHSKAPSAFGSAVACNKELLAASAPYGQIPERELGAVFLFNMAGEVVHEFGYDVAVDGGSYSGFGESIAMSDSHIVIGIPEHDGGRGRVDWYHLADPSCGRSRTRWSGFGSGVAISGEKIVATHRYDEAGGVGYVFHADLDFVHELFAFSCVDDFCYNIYPGPNVAFFDDTVLVADVGDIDDYVDAKGVAEVAAGGETGAASAASSGQTNAEHTSSRPQPKARRAGASKPPRASRVRPAGKFKAEAEDDDGPSYDNYAGTGYVFELTYPRESDQTASGRDVVGDDEYDPYNDGFGNSVATSQMYTVIGAPGTGVVHVYSADRQWQRLLHPSEPAWDFGFSVALLGDWVLVGAPDQDSQGAAFLYSAVSGEQLYKLPNDELWDARFGHSVALCGDNKIAVVGAPHQDTEYNEVGEVRVFLLKPEGAVHLATLRPEEPYSKVYFGTSVSCYDRYIAVGAPSGLCCGDDERQWPRVYLYEISEDLSDVTLRQVIRVSDDQYHDVDGYQSRFGASVAITKDWLVIGAPQAYTPEYGVPGGAVVAYSRTGSLLGSYQIYFANDPTWDAEFGTSVAIDGDLLAVGARRAQGKHPDEGAAYTFDLKTRQPLDKLVQEKMYTATENLFGGSVAMAAGNIVVGRNWSLNMFDDKLLNDLDRHHSFGGKTRNPASLFQWLAPKRTPATPGTFAAEAFDDDYYDDDFGCLGTPEVQDDYVGGTVGFFLNMYPSSCTETTPPAPGKPNATSITDVSAVIAWEPSIPECYPVTSYVVYIYTEGSFGYQQAAVVHGANWATVELEPWTNYRAKVAAVNSLGNVVYSSASEIFTTLNTSYIRYASSGVELDVYVTSEFADEVSSGSACALADYFSDPAAQFGESSSCRYVNFHTMKVQLAAGALVVPGTALNFTSPSSGEVTEFVVEAPTAPLEITGELSWSVEVSFCDEIVLDASSFSGVGGSVYGFEYDWQLASIVVGGEVPEDAEFYVQLFDDIPSTEAVVTFPNGTFPAGAQMLVYVSVSSPVFDESYATAERGLGISEIPVPKISVTPASLRVGIADPVTVQVEVDYGNCFLQWAGPNYIPRFIWSVSGGSTIEQQVSADTRSVRIPGLQLKDTTNTDPYTIQALLWLPQQAVITSTATVNVFTHAPVAYIAGGDHAVSVSDQTTIVDASLSYDPNYCSAFSSCSEQLTFGYDCSYSDGSTCCGLAAANQPWVSFDLVETLACSPEGSEAESAVATVQVTVTGKKTGLSSTAVVRLQLLNGGGSAVEAVAVEPVLPNSFSGFAGLSSPSTTTSTASAHSLSSTHHGVETVAASPVTWSVIRALTGQAIATMQGETAIFDMSGWPAGEQFTLQAFDGSTYTRMLFFTPLPPTRGSFKLRSGATYLGTDESVLGLSTTLSLHALDFVASTGSTGGGLTYQFTDTVEVFSAANQSAFAITLALNEPMSTNSLSGVVLSPGQHTLRVTVSSSDNGVVEASRPAVATAPYASFEELLALLLNFREEDLSARTNGVGAFAAALSWIAEGAEDVCGEYAPELALGQEKLLRVWLAAVDRAAQQPRTALKALQEVYLLTLPGLCLGDDELALLALQGAAKVFQAIPEEELPAESCGMMTQVLSAALALPNVTVADMDGLQVVLQFMDGVLESYCGVSVFSYDSDSTQLSAFLGAGSFLRDVSLSSVRAPPGQPLALDLDGMLVEVDSSAATDLLRKLSSSSSSSSSGGEDGFWDVSSYRVSRASLGLSDPASDVLSDVFELNIRQAQLPGFRFCNRVPGNSETCVTKRVGSSSVSGLRSPIVFTVLADPITVSGFEYSCQYVDPESNRFSTRGCQVLSVVPQGNSSAGMDAEPGYNASGNSSVVAVTCACNHLTAFAVRQMALAGTSECDDMDSEWKDTYHTPQYKAFATLMLLAWLALLVMLTLWLRSVAKTIKHTNASLVANLLFYPACILRIIYYAMLVHGFDASSNVACVEFGIAGSGSGYGQFTMPVLHDLAEPLLLIAFTSIVVYWYELEKSLSGPLSKMLSAKYLSTNTLWLFIAVDVLLLVLLVGVNFGLLARDDNDEGERHDSAQSLLVVQSVVCIVEAAAFVFYGRAVVKAGGGVGKMRKVVKLLCSSSVMFIVMAALQIVFASPDTVSDPRVTYGLYSVVLHLAEFAGSAMMIQALAATRKDGRTLIGSLLQRFTSSTASAKWWPTSMFSSSSSGGGRNISAAASAPVAVAKDMELVVSHYDFDKDQYVSRSAKGGKADGGKSATAVTSTTSTSVADSSVMPRSVG